LTRNKFINNNCFLSQIRILVLHTMQNWSIWF